MSRDKNEDNGGLVDSDSKDRQMFVTSKWHLFGILSFIILYYVGYISAFMVNNQYIYYRYALDHGITRVGQISGCAANVSVDLKQRTSMAQQESAQLEFYVAIASGVPSIISVFVVSSLSDRYGRKLAMFIPWITSLFTLAIHAFIILLDLSLMWYIPAAIIGGLGGSYASMLASIFATTADITTKAYRALGIGIVEASLTLSITVAQAVTGSWITASGFKPPTIFFSILCAVSIIPYLALIPETSPSLRNRNQLPLTFRAFGAIATNAVDVFRSNMSRAKCLSALIACFFFEVFALFSFGVINLYLFDLPFCWNSQQIGVFFAVDTVFSQIILVVTLAVAKKCIKSSDSSLLILSLVSDIGQKVVFGLASLMGTSFGTILLWGSRLVGLFTKLPAVMLRSMLSKSVEPSEQGAIFGAVAVVQVFAGLFGGTLITSIYKTTEPFFSGFVFLVLAGFLFIALLFAIVYTAFLAKNNAIKLSPVVDVSEEAVDVVS